jgi:hypothetical protein
MISKLLLEPGTIEFSPEAVRPTSRRKAAQSQILFFFKNIFLSPSTNPVCVVLGVVVAILWVTRDLTPHDILFVMAAIAISAFWIGSSAVAGEKGHVAPFFALLPQPLHATVRRLLAASCVYAIVVQAGLALLLWNRTGLPFIGNAQVVQTVAPSGEVLSSVTGFTVSVDNTELGYQEIMRPSLVLGSYGKHGYGLFAGWVFFLPLVFAGATVSFFCQGIGGALKKTGRSTPAIRISHVVILVLIGALLFADVCAPSLAVWQCRLWLDKHAWLSPIAAGAIALWFIGGTILVAGEIRRTEA